MSWGRQCTVVFPICSGLGKTGSSSSQRQMVWTLLTKLTLRLFNDCRHALAAGLFLRQPDPEPNEDLVAVLLRVLLLAQGLAADAGDRGGECVAGLESLRCAVEDVRG